MLKKIIWLCSLCLIVTPLFAATQYNIIIDAGSSGSRIHLFKYTNDKLPVINEVMSEKNTVPLASFANQTDKNAAGRSLEPLIDDAFVYLRANRLDANSVAIHVFGTGGMRSLTENEQNEIYKNVKQFIINNYAKYFPGVEQSEAYTITGEMEGLYDWLDVNYLSGTFSQKTPSLGSIDMGGASTQIAFENASANSMQLTINDKQYFVFTKSFLGLGQDYSRNSINTYQTANTCYPDDYPLSTNLPGKFNFTTCTATYDQLIGKYHVNEEVPAIPTDMRFIAFSGVYYTYHFFTVDTAPDQTNVEKHINNTCQQSWESLQTQYPNEPYLATYCAAGVYINDLLANTYHLTGPTLSVLSQINQQNIDWSIGAMLYQLITK